VAGLVTAVLVPLGSVGAAPQPAQGRSAHGKVTRDRLKLVRKVNVRQLTTSGVAGQTASGSLAREAGPWARFEQEREGSAANVPGAPSPSNTSVVVNENTNGWEGLDHTDQRFAGGGNQFSLEPPDQGLCGGGGSPNDPSYGPEVVESVNDAVVFYDARMHQLGLPLSLSQFYGLPPT